MSDLSSLTFAVDQKLSEVELATGQKPADVPLAIAQKATGVTGDRTSSADRFGNTWSSMVGTGEGDEQGVFGNVKDSFAEADKAWDEINKPVKEGDSERPPTEAEKNARILNAVQLKVDAYMDALSMPADMFNMGFANLTAPLAAICPPMPAATLLSLYIGIPHAHTHPPSANPVPTPLPSIGMVMFGTCVQVLINYLPAARAGDIGLAMTCGGFTSWFEIMTGSSNVFIGGSRAARMGDICMACFPSTSKDDPKKALTRMQKIVHIARTAMDVASVAVSGVGVAFSVAGAISEANMASDDTLEQEEIEDHQAMKEAQILAAAMGAAQMASDITAMAVRRAMGKDPAVTPSLGALVFGWPNVWIGGFPMINFLDTAGLILNRLKRYKGKSPNKHNDDKKGQDGFSDC
jgi:uncharacterized Zn-binding protein involved in type VI secretion